MNEEGRLVVGCESPAHTVRLDRSRGCSLTAWDMLQAKGQQLSAFRYGCQWGGGNGNIPTPMLTTTRSLVMPVQYATRWRVYIFLRGRKYYANEDAPIKLPRVRWSTMSQEYPDCFDRAMADLIQEYYNEKDVRLEKVVTHDEGSIG